MPHVLTASDMIMCPHGGQVSISPGQTRAKADGALVVRPDGVFAVAGCAFSTGAGPHPCVVVEWQAPATRVKAGIFVLTTASIGVCKAADQAPQGTALIQKTQTRTSAQ